MTRRDEAAGSDGKLMRETDVQAVVQAAPIPGAVVGEQRREPGAENVNQTTSREPATHRETFAAVLREHDHDLRMLVHRLLGDTDIMDDVLQEAYLRAYRGMAGFRNQASLATWLYRITYNLCLDRLRSRARPSQYHARTISLDSLHEVGFEPASSDDDLSVGIGARSDLERALSRLGAEQRAAVLLVDALGYDYSTASHILGVPEGTLASRLHQARAALRCALSETGTR